MKQFALPFNVHIDILEDGLGRISSDLDEALSAADGEKDEKGIAAANAIESLLLALACAGVDVGTAEFSTGLLTATNAIGNNL